MAHDVFISYSSKNKAAADEVCAAIESRNIPCWIAPRDITPGTEWSESIINALEECRVMVIIFSADSNQSPQVKREAERAVSKGVIILPVRIEDVYPSGAMEYYLSTSHWMDAVPQITAHLDNLVHTVESLLVKGERDAPLGGLPEASDVSKRVEPRGAAHLPRLIHKEEEALPDDLAGFNLGAFLLNRSWLISHHATPGFFVGLILSLPYVGLLLWLIFGAAMLKIALIFSLGIIGWLWAGLRGNELAWENRAWINKDHFRRAQSGWLVKGLIFWAIVAVLGGVLVKSRMNRAIANQVTAVTTKVMRNPTISDIKKSAESAKNNTLDKAMKQPAKNKKP